MRIVCISDTHTEHSGLRMPPGDLLVHAGDICASGRLSELQRFATWAQALPYAHKLVIAGNHDRCLDRRVGHRMSDADVAERSLLAAGLTYLNDGGHEIDGIRFWGSPWTPTFGQWSFMESESELRLRWDSIDNQPHVLITHGPAYGRLDTTDQNDCAGSSSLAAWVARHPVALHICGHIHEGHGRLDDRYTSINAAICDLRYAPVNPPQVVDVTLKDGVLHVALDT